MNQYKVVDGDIAIAREVADQLETAARTFWSQKDLKWAFPYVYCLVTHELIKQVGAGTFDSGGRVFRWIGNFYELYVLNLNSFVNRGVAEPPWMDAFTQPYRLRPFDPFGARSLAAFILGMYAHIKSDLPRALAFIYLKFYSPDRPMPTPGAAGPLGPGDSCSYNDAKSDFDTMNNRVFPAVMRQMAAGGTGIIPGITDSLPDGFQDGLLGYFADRSGLPSERATAWDLGAAYAADPRVKDTATQLQITDAITPVRIS
jgi:hypothetical protein